MSASFRSNADSTGSSSRHDWGSLTWMANEELTQTAGITLGRTVIRPGKCNPRHCHPNCEEVLYLMKGQLRHSVGDRLIDMRAGDTISIPAGVYHNAVNTGTEDADMIVAFSSGKRDFQLEAG